MTGSAHLQAEPPVEVAGAAELLALLGVGFLRSAMPMICLDETLDIACANPAAHLLLDAESLSGRSFSALGAELSVTAQWWEIQQATIGRAATEMAPSLEIELRLLTDAGDILDAVTLLEDIVVDSGEHFLLLQIRDVTADRVQRHALADMRGRYRQLAQAMPDSSVVLYDNDLRVVLATGDGLPEAGSAAELLIGRPLREAVGDEIFARLEGRYRAVLLGRSCDIDYTSTNIGRQYRVRMRPLRDSGGETAGGLAVCADVSAHRRRRDHLEQVRQLSEVGSCWYERGSGWACDDEMLLLWGADAPASVPDLLAELVVPEDRPSFVSSWQDAASRGGQRTFRYRIRHQITGELRYLRSAVAFVVDEAGVLVRAIATTVDISDSVSAREAAADAKVDGAAQRAILLRQIGDMLASTHGGGDELLQGIVNIAALALDSAAVLAILDEKGAGAERVLVAHPANAAGELADAMSLSAQFSEPGPLRRLVIDQGQIVSTLTTQGAVADYHQRFGELTGWSIEHSVSAPIRHNGKVLGLFSVLRADPTAPFEAGDDDLVQILADRIGGLFAENRVRLSTEAERDHRLRELVEQQKELLDELAGMETRERSLLAESIHDEPIQLIVASIMRIDRLALRAGPAEREELDKIASQLEVTVDWLRNLIVVALTPPELSEGLGVALADLADGIFLGTTKFCLEGPHDVPLSEGGKAAAFRILREALVNTRKHAMAQNVTLRMSEHDGVVDISLTDDGVGAHRIESVSGHLGMATMRARADAEGGRLQVDSAPGLGTTVTLTLPAMTGGRS